MPDDVSSERVAMLAAAARVPLAPEAAARVARSVTPTAARFAAGSIALPMETEPATFIAVQREDAGR